VTFVEAKRTFTDRGFEVAIDNLGAGHSGLERTAHLKPHYLKLSRELARDIDSSDLRREMTRALKSFADSIGSTIIATGIEREGELQVLLEMGVEYGQGWLLGRPLDARRGRFGGQSSRGSVSVHN
jgi:EAL domain-containing protein (putative c-di-GMP-specific phosphodiesterase class I)